MASKGRGRRGSAASLKRYWGTGKGSAKIRWNTPGDFTRCSRQLTKYLGPRAKGYCAQLHRERTGVWPGDRRNVGRHRGVEPALSVAAARIRRPRRVR